MTAAKEFADIARKIAAEAAYLDAVANSPAPQFQAREFLTLLQTHLKQAFDALNRIEQ